MSPLQAQCQSKPPQSRLKASENRTDPPKIEPSNRRIQIRIIGTVFAYHSVMKWGFLIILFLSVTAEGRIPTVQEVQQETIREAGFDRRELEDWKKRARWAAALPRLQVGLDRQLKDVVSLTTKDNISLAGGEVLVGPNENNFDQDFQQGTAVEVTAARGTPRTGTTQWTVERS